LVFVRLAPDAGAELAGRMIVLRADTEKRP